MVYEMVLTLVFKAMPHPPYLKILSPLAKINKLSKMLSIKNLNAATPLALSPPLPSP